MVSQLLFAFALICCLGALIGAPLEQKGESNAALARTRALIAKHNAAHARGQVSFRLAENHLAHLNASEYRQRCGFRVSATRRRNPPVARPNAAKNHLPESVDWRKMGVVTPVKDQGQCGSCWAFSATGALEGAHAKAAGQLVSLSEQNLVDCSTKNSGCNGGLMDLAFEYVHDNGGIDTEQSYPYLAKDGNCTYSNRNVGATVASFVDLATGDEEALKAAVAEQGPISVAIDASSFLFQLYSDGVYNDWFCGNEESDLDHGVLLVGYGTDPKDGDYWIVKNSWGPDWGEKGYIRMARNNNNMCGIATMASYPKV